MEVGDRVADGVALQVADVRLAARVGQHLEHVGVRWRSSAVGRGRAAAGRCLVGYLPGALARPQLLPAWLDLLGVVAVLCHRQSQVSGRPARRPAAPRARRGARQGRARLPPAPRSGCGSQQLDDLRRRLVRRAGVERRLRVVLDPQLDRLGDRVAGDPRGQRERHVDAGGDAGGGDELAVEHHALVDRLGAEPRSSSNASQWLVARLPSSRPAAARISDPVHTDVVHVLVRSASRSQSSAAPPARAATSPGPPGTSTMSGARCPPSERSASSVSMPLSVRTGPARRRRT